MKKFILSMSVCSMVLLFSNCTNKDNNIIIEIPDANFKAYLLENFDKNSDGNISLSEAKAVKEINCSGKNIESLNGIQTFANLKSLDCSNNKLNELNLNNNKKLDKLVCNGNNIPFTLYIGMSSKLKNPSIQKPKDNEPPQTNNFVKYLDGSKCTYDEKTTNIYLSFED